MGYAARVLPKVVLLDLDDTLVRFSSGRPNYWRGALGRHVDAEQIDGLLERIAELSQEFWLDSERAFWGRQNMWQARRLIARRALTGRDEPHEVADRVGDAMTRDKERGVCLFDGAIEFLRELGRRGHRLGLLTNGSSEFQRLKLERFDLERWFEVILVEGELGYGKPDRRVFETALERFDCCAGDACMVGDNLRADVGGAQAIGITGIWHDCDRLGRVPDDVPVVPDRIVCCVSDLL